MMSDHAQRSEDWAVVFTYEAASDESSLEKLAGELEPHDASVAALPPDRVTITAHRVAPGPVEAMTESHLLIAAIVTALIDVAVLVAVEVMTEADYERQADAPTLPTLVGASEVGEMLGVSRQRVHQLRHLPTFPAPLVEVAMGPLWEERAIQAFGRDWTRRPGRPRLAVAQ